MNTALNHSLKIDSPWIVGVLNVTPDSFSDGGSFLAVDGAIRQAEELLTNGAHIIEIGGESTAPGRSPISAAEELGRIETIVKALAPRCFVSIDTYKAETAKRCLALGAQMINDVSALRGDSQMVEVVREFRPFLVLMYSKESGAHPHATESARAYQDVVSDIAAFLRERMQFAQANGLPRDRLVVDPGMGRFISTEASYSWEVIRRFDEFLQLESPLMISVSRKGFLGGDLAERDPVSQLVALGAYLRGADLIRTHNAKMMGAFLAAWRHLEGTPQFYDAMHQSALRSS